MAREIKAWQRKRQETKYVATLEAENWNLKHPVGTSVLLHTDSKGDIHTNTRSEAYVCKSGYAVCFFEGISGYYLLNRATPEFKTRAGGSGLCRGKKGVL